MKKLSKNFLIVAIVILVFGVCVLTIGILDSFSTEIKESNMPMLMEIEEDQRVIGTKRSGNTKYTINLISTITFVNAKQVPKAAEASWDVSYTKRAKEIIAWVIPNDTYPGTYDLYIGANAEKIQAPEDSRRFV